MNKEKGYIKTRIHLSEGQKEKLQKAFHHKSDSLTLQIKNETPNFEILLTPRQIQRIQNRKRINLSRAQLNTNQNGGFLPFLIPFLTTLATGALSGAAGWGTFKLLNKVTGGQKKKGGGVLEREYIKTGNIQPSNSRQHEK